MFLVVWSWMHFLTSHPPHGKGWIRPSFQTRELVQYTMNFSRSRFGNLLDIYQAKFTNVRYRYFWVQSQIHLSWSSLIRKCYFIHRSAERYYISANQTRFNLLIATCWSPIGISELCQQYNWSVHYCTSFERFLALTSSATSAVQFFVSWLAQHHCIYRMLLVLRSMEMFVYKSINDCISLSFGKK